MIRRLLRPSDLTVIAVLVVASAWALLAPGTPQAIEWALGVPFLVLYPGYAIVSATFPQAPDESAPPSTSPGSGPSWVARLALAFGTGGVAVAAIGVVIGWTVGYRLQYAVVAVGTVTLVALVVAALRRLQHPRERRADPLAGGVIPLPWGSRLQAIAVILAILALVATVGYVGSTPPPRDGFTEFSVLSEGDDGALVAADYPRTFVADEGHPLYFAIENHEGREMQYEVVVVAETVRTGGTVTDVEQVDRFGVEVPADEQAVIERQIAPTTWNDGVRLRFLLYKGAAPDDPDVDSSDLSLHLWIDVVER